MAFNSGRAHWLITFQTVDAIQNNCAVFFSAIQFNLILRRSGGKKLQRQGATDGPWHGVEWQRQCRHRRRRPILSKCRLTQNIGKEVLCYLNWFKSPNALWLAIVSHNIISAKIRLIFCCCSLHSLLAFLSLHHSRVNCVHETCILCTS